MFFFSVTTRNEMFATDHHYDVVGTYSVVRADVTTGNRLPSKAYQETRKPWASR